MGTSFCRRVRLGNRLSLTLPPFPSSPSPSPPPSTSPLSFPFPPPLPPSPSPSPSPLPPLPPPLSLPFPPSPSPSPPQCLQCTSDSAMALCFRAGTNTSSYPFLVFLKDPSGRWHRLLAIRWLPWVNTRSSRSTTRLEPS